MSKMYFVAVGIGKLTVQRPDDTIKEFPLTPEGCEAAGTFMRKEGQEKWLCSSSVDFPEEENPDWNGDIREMMKMGYEFGE